jgi:ABC-type branched-subunit amino acid transport system ATPase component
MTVLLEASGLVRRFGGVQALANVSFTVEEGEIRAVIGPNGAGKTTLLDVITGFTPPEAGSVKLKGAELLGLPPHRLASRGLMRTFQATRLIPGLTVRDNVMLGAHHLTRARFLANGLWLPRARREERALRQRADRVLGFLELTGVADRDTRSLPAGTQRLVEVGRALAAGPSLLLLDEPGAGLVESEIRALADVLRAVRSSGATVVLIEHNVNMVMSLSDRVLVLNAGGVIADDLPTRVRKDPAVLAAYLGGGES